MSLTGSLFLGIVILLTVAAFVGLVLLWPRLAVDSPKAIAGRVGLVLGVNAMVLLTAATAMNAHYLFFADWNDLRGFFGAGTGATSVSRGGDAVQATGSKVAGAAASSHGTLPGLPANGVGSNGVLTFTVIGPKSGIIGSVTVELPPGYTSPADATVRYPVIETFQGYPATTMAWIKPMHLGSVMAQVVQAHDMRSALLVSPQAEIPDGVDGECVNGEPGRPQVETWLSQDVPDWVASHFRIQDRRTSWATIGLSLGGWCAGMLAMLHPAQYSAAIVMGGYFRPTFGSLYEPYPADGLLARRYDMVALAGRTPPPVAMWMETSHADGLSYSSSAALLRVARAPMAIDAVVLQHAGHRISVWQGLLPDSLRWLGATVPGFKAV